MQAETLVLPSDPAWPGLFEAESERLEKALAPSLDGGIHHVGSTSVPGLAAKPVIDMLAGVRDLEEARAAFEPLAALGYRHREHRPEAHAFFKPDGSRWGASHHVHLTEPGSAVWCERLAFRDALRADPALRREYEELKRSLAAGGAYDARRKRPLVQRVLAESGIDLLPDRERLVPAAYRPRP